MWDLFSREESLFDDKKSDISKAITAIIEEIGKSSQL